MATKKNNIIDIDLSVTQKKKFRIDKDDNRIIELNTSDMTILSRLSERYNTLDQLGMKAQLLGETDDFQETAKTLMEIDAEMRNLIDYIFDSKISDICAPDGSMYDMFNGEFRFEHILSTLLTLYENNVDAEYKMMSKRVKKHTDKYVGK